MGNIRREWKVKEEKTSKNERQKKYYKVILRKGNKKEQTRESKKR